MTSPRLRPSRFDTEVLPHFPTLTAHPSYVFADNAGGSAVLSSSISAISDYLVHSNVQLGGGYPFSASAGRRVRTGPEATARLVNVEGGAGQVVMGSSTTQLASNLGYACTLGEGLFEKGDEIVLSAADHEANVGPWMRLAETLGLAIKWWLPTPLDPSAPFSLGLQPAALLPLLGPKTRLVAFTATSNLLGHFTPVKEVVKAVKERTAGRAMTVVDCVAYAPHGRIDMREWGCDAVLFSYYKLFAPHLSCLVIAPSSPLSSLTSSLGHYFHPSAPSYKLAPGGAPYELQVGCAEVLPYLVGLGGGAGAAAGVDKEQAALDTAFARIRAHERALSARLLEYLTGPGAEKGVRVVGPQTAEGRAPTISFVVVDAAGGEVDGRWKKHVASKDLVKVFDEGGEIGIKYGHFYATRIMPLLPLVQDGEVLPGELATSGQYVRTGSSGNDGAAWRPQQDEDAVVRISLAHYNTLEQVDRIIAQLEAIL